MKTRPLAAAGLVAALVVAGGFGLRWLTTPVVPPLPLERMEKPVADAVAAARDELQQDPRSGAAWGKLAVVLGANGYLDESADCLAWAEHFDPADPRWPYLRGHLLTFREPRAAVPLLERALARAGSGAERAAIHFRLALVLLEDGELDAAEGHLQALHEIEPGGARERFGRGLLAAARDDRPAAREQLAPLTANPFARKSTNGRLAALALADGDLGLARVYQQRAAELPADVLWPDPFLDAMNRHAVSRQNRFLEAESLEANGRLPESLALLRQIAAQTPDARAYLALGLALGKLGQFDEAEDVLRTVLRLDAGNMQAHHFLATVLVYRAEKLLAAMDRERGLALMRQAVAEEDRALAVQPDHAFAHLTRGKALRALGQTDAALASLREAVVCRPEFADTHLALGEALTESGQVAAALPHLEDAARLAGRDDPRPRAALEKWRAAANR